MTDQEIEKASKSIDDYNIKVAEEALAEFAKGDMSEKVWEVGYLTEEVTERLNAVRSGNAPEQFGPFEEDMLARALATELFCRADGQYLDKKRSKASTDGKPVIHVCPLRIRTDALDKWSQLVLVLCEYLRTAAALAKSVCSDPAASHFYLRAWHIANDVATRTRGMECATADEALAIVRLHRRGCDRLWTDIAYRDLPPFAAVKDLPPPQHKPRGVEIVGIVHEA